MDRGFHHIEPAEAALLEQIIKGWTVFHAPIEGKMIKKRKRRAKLLLGSLTDGIDGSDANEARCQEANVKRRPVAISSSTKLAKALKAMEKRGRIKLFDPPWPLTRWAETNKNQCVMHELRAA
jgi:hypothetical protein